MNRVSWDASALLVWRSMIRTASSPKPAPKSYMEACDVIHQGQQIGSHTAWTVHSVSVAPEKVVLEQSLWHCSLHGTLCLEKYILQCPCHCALHGAHSTIQATAVCVVQFTEMRPSQCLCSLCIIHRSGAHWIVADMSM